MDCNNAPDLAILHRYINDIDILHHYNKLVSFHCMAKISYNFKEQLFQRKPFSGFPVDTGRKLNVHKTSRTSCERLIKVQLTFCVYRVLPKRRYWIQNAIKRKLNHSRKYSIDYKPQSCRLVFMKDYYLFEMIIITEKGKKITI